MGQAWGLTSPCLCPASPSPGAQENLLLSVLPAHISMGMKLTIIERLKECGDRRYLPDNNFHSLYVKRHQNVRWVGRGASLPPHLGCGDPELRLQSREVWGRRRLWLPRQP